MFQVAKQKKSCDYMVTYVGKYTYLLFCLCRLLSGVDDVRRRLLVTISDIIALYELVSLHNRLSFEEEEEEDFKLWPVNKSDCS